jgi:serine phosphatase RsbU (regulator of sigma subunit)
MSIRVRLQSPHAAAVDFDFDGPEIAIGRATTAGLVIQDSRVSRQHARLVERDGQWWVEDLGTRNGTLVNGTPLEGTRRWRAGDRLHIGDTTVTYLAPEGQATVPVVPDDPGDSADPVAGARHETAWASRDGARMSTLNDIHRALAGPLTVPALLDLILARCFDVLHPEEGAILLRAPDGAMVTAASRRQGVGAPVSVPRRLIDEVAGKGQPALVLDAAYDDRFAGSHSVMAAGIRSIVAAPISDADGTLGLITLCSRLAVRKFAQPDLDMLVSIASAAALRVRNVALAEALAARRVIEHELALAHDVQMSMLPRRLPARPEVLLGAQLKPAREIGGDLYDFVVDGDRLWFIVADVAGKSIAAALYMAIVKTLFRATARDGADVEAVAAGMNRELARENESLMFVTAAIASLDLVSGELAIVDAGHNPALLIDAGGRTGVLDVVKCVALGVVADAPYQARRIQVDPGATLVLYTDGMTDARDIGGAMFGEARLREAIVSAAGEPPDALVAQAIAAVERFATGAPPEDDLTLLAVRYLG